MMKRYIKQLSLAMGLGLTAAFSGCSDNILSEITSLETSRLFSPTDIEARIVNQTGVRLTWKAVKNASSYTIEFFEGESSDFSGSPVRTITDVGIDELPYIVSGLEGETTYTVRIKAIGQGIDDSKWISTVVTTETEQIFQQVDIAEIEADQVILRWPSGETATQIILEPGTITHAVTAEEIANGVAIITGLIPETSYQARLINNGKTRGVVQFTTLIDLGGAIAVNPEDDLTAIIADANDGDVFALMPGEYTVEDMLVTKSISIRAARPADRPVVKGAVFRISSGASLELNNLVLDGTGAKDDNQTIVYAAGTFDHLKIEDCIISNYVKGALYVNTATLIESVTIRNTIYHHIECNGGDFIDFRNGIARSFEFVNNTVYTSALARDFFRMDGGGSNNFPGVTSVITISNNTFNNVSNGDNRRILYIRLASHEIHFTKNIIANTNGYYSNQGTTTITTMSNNNYHNAPNFTASSQSNAKNDTGTYTTFNPGFTNPDNGNFTISHEELIFQRIGDPRWIR